MANVDNPSGFTPVRHLSGAPYNGATNRYAILAANGTATFVNDLVVVGGSGTADGVPSVIQAAATNTNIVGSVVGFEILPTDLTVMYRLASTLRYALVCDDPYVIYEAQEDSDSAALTVDEIGENCDIVVGSGNTTSGISAMEIDSSDHKTATAQIRVVRLVPREDNAIGNQARWEVLINEHAYKSTSGT
jgi:hypothetical protein